MEISKQENLILTKIKQHDVNKKIISISNKTDINFKGHLL